MRVVLGIVVVSCVVSFLSVISVASCSSGVTSSFSAEVPKLMDIIIYSLYKNLEIFLRELISNASDALVKFRRAVASDGDIANSVSGDHDFSIRIVPDISHRRLIIMDSGIGMDDEELQLNLGTIARSGTKEFLKAFKDKSDDTSLIGQFGVGFYSAFLVADNVTVISKSYKNSNKYLWHSNIKENTFSIEAIDDSHELELEYPVRQGTKIILHLKENLSEDAANPEAKNLLDETVLRDLIKKYSEFIDFPIYLRVNKTITTEIPFEEESKNEDTQNIKVEDVEENETPKTKTVTTYGLEWEQVNQMKPIWTREASSVTEEEYAEFYKSFTKDSHAPIDRFHFNVEGESNYKGIIFIPLYPPYQPFTKDDTGKYLKLYMKRVFITDEFSELIPRYMAFIRMVLDIENIPLNVSRENLQKHKILTQVRDYAISKTLGMISKMSQNATLYDTFYSGYSGHLKLGLLTEENSKRKMMLAELLRFKSSFSLDNNTSLDGYISRMKPDQTDIYFITGSSVKEMNRLPQIGKALKRGFEVIYMDESFDEYIVQSFTEFKGKMLKNLAKSGAKFDALETNMEEMKMQFKPLTGYLAKLLSKTIENVEISDSLESPMAIMSSAYGWTAQMERIMKNNKNDPMSMFFLNQKRVMEINPHHPLIVSMLEQIIQSDSNPSDDFNADVQLLYDSALINSGYDLPSPSSFVLAVENTLRQKYGHQTVAIPVEETEKFEFPSFFGAAGQEDGGFGSMDFGDLSGGTGFSDMAHHDIDTEPPMPESRPVHEEL